MFGQQSKRKLEIAEIALTGWIWMLPAQLMHELRHIGLVHRSDAVVGGALILGPGIRLSSSGRRMAIRVGIDLVSVDDVRASLETHGERYLSRVYSPQEIADCGEAGNPDPQRLAARFAAKEAAFKALRVGNDAISWLDVEVRRGAEGEVDLELTGQAAALAQEAGITQLALSFTHEHESAAAVVIAEIS